MAGSSSSLRIQVNSAPLFPQLAGTLDTDPWGAAEAAAEETGATVLLKGVPSVVASAGRATQSIAVGTPGLATGGSGDILAGICGTMLGSTGRAGGGVCSAGPRPCR